MKKTLLVVSSFLFVVLLNGCIQKDPFAVLHDPVLGRIAGATGTSAAAVAVTQGPNALFNAVRSSR